MRFATILAVGLCVAVPAPVAAIASEGVTKVPKHRVHMHQVVHGSSASATALVPPFVIVSTTPRPRSDTASAEGYYGRGDAGFSWEPHRWWR